MRFAFFVVSFIRGPKPGFIQPRSPPFAASFSQRPDLRSTRWVQLERLPTSPYSSSKPPSRHPRKNPRVPPDFGNLAPPLFHGTSPGLQFSGWRGFAFFYILPGSQRMGFQNYTTKSTQVSPAAHSGRSNEASGSSKRGLNRRK